MDLPNESSTAASDLYKKDFYAWSFKQAALLKDKRFEELDFVNLVDEIEDMAKSVRRSLDSSYRLVIAHLLKMKYQPAHATRSWLITVSRERDNIMEQEQDNPSLAREMPDRFDRNYARARKDAALEMNKQINSVPQESPFSWEQVRNDAYFPEESKEKLITADPEAKK